VAHRGTSAARVRRPGTRTLTRAGTGALVSLPYLCRHRFSYCVACRPSAVVNLDVQQCCQHMLADCMTTQTSVGWQNSTVFNPFVYHALFDLRALVPDTFFVQRPGRRGRLVRRAANLFRAAGRQPAGISWPQRILSCPHRCATFIVRPASSSESCSQLPDCQGAGVALPRATSSKCARHYDSVCRCAAAGISDPAAAFWGGQFQSTTLHGASPVRGVLSGTEPVMQTKPAATDTLVKPAPPGRHAVLHPHRRILATKALAHLQTLPLHPEQLTCSPLSAELALHPNDHQRSGSCEAGPQVSSCRRLRRAGAT